MPVQEISGFLLLLVLSVILVILLVGVAMFVLASVDPDDETGEIERMVAHSQLPHRQARLGKDRLVLDEKGEVHFASDLQ